MKTYFQSGNNFTEKVIEKEIELPSVKFKTGNILIIDKELGELRLLGKNQTVQLVISVNEDALVLNINALVLNINASDELNFSGKKINIDAVEQLSIKSGGNFVQQIDKDSLTEVGGINKMIAQIQKITANLGNVELKANDDVRLNGERVKLNCD